MGISSIPGDLCLYSFGLFG